MKKIVIEVTEPNQIIGSPEYGKAVINFKPEGLTTNEIVIILNSILGGQINELIKESDILKQRIINLQAPGLNRV